MNINEDYDFSTTLIQFPYFSNFNKELINQFQKISTVEAFSAGELLISEGQSEEDVYLIIDGTVEVQKKLTATQQELVAVLHAGDWLGAPEHWLQSGMEKILPDSWTQSATVIAKSPTKTLKIHSSQYNYFITHNRQFDEAIKRNRKQIILYNFIRTSIPFQHLSRAQMNSLETQIQSLSVSANEIILNEGELSSRCYLIFSGKVEVSIKKFTVDGVQSESRVLTHLTEGDIFGEMSLLAKTVCNATVRTLSPCELFYLEREFLENILKRDIKVSKNFSYLLLTRSRPLGTPNIEVLKHLTYDNKITYVLKNSELQNYFHLTEEGYFIWKHLNGNYTTHELAELYLKEFKKLDLSYVEELVTKLSSSGFVQIHKLKVDHAVEKVSKFEKFLSSLNKIMEATYVIKNVDPFLNRIYAFGVYLLFTKIAQVIMIGLSFVGIYLFIELFSSSILQISTSHSKVIYLFFIFLIRFLDLVVHEMGHAFTTIYYKQPIKSIGITWHWIQPFVFVDTSSMWSCPPKERIMVDIAGMYAECVFIGILMIIAFFSNNMLLQSALWLFGLIAYINIYFNLNPTLKLDGYYFLMDLLNVPNLRARSTLWILKIIKRTGKTRLFLEYPKAIFYWSISLFYIISTIVISSLLSHYILDTLDIHSAIVVRWVITFLITILSFLGIFVEIKNQL